MTAAHPTWRLANGRAIALDSARILGILNITPDSFSDGGKHDSIDSAVEHARRMIDDGAGMIDIGGESTRPGAQRVSPEEQIRRVVPVIRAIRAAGIHAPISVDTTRAAVARAALEAGADAINDVSAGMEDEGMLPLAAERGVGMILMHRRVAPAEDVFSHQYASAPDYDARGGVVEAVRVFLEGRARAAREAGVAHEAIVLDPGLGFGKSVEQNYQLISGMARLATLGYPLLSAASRKSFLGAASGIKDPAARVAASVAVSVTHFLMGVRLFRVHDIAEHAQALRKTERLAQPSTPSNTRD